MSILKCCITFTYGLAYFCGYWLIFLLYCSFRFLLSLHFVLLPHLIKRFFGKFRQLASLSPIIEIIVFHKSWQAVYHRSRPQSSIEQRRFLEYVAGLPDFREMYRQGSLPHPVSEIIPSPIRQGRHRVHGGSSSSVSEHGCCGILVQQPEHERYCQPFQLVHHHVISEIAFVLFRLETGPVYDSPSKRFTGLYDRGCQWRASQESQSESSEGSLL